MSNCGEEREPKDLHTRPKRRRTGDDATPCPVCRLALRPGDISAHLQVELAKLQTKRRRRPLAKKIGASSSSARNTTGFIRTQDTHVPLSMLNSSRALGPTNDGLSIPCGSSSLPGMVSSKRDTNDIGTPAASQVVVTCASSEPTPCAGVPSSEMTVETGSSSGITSEIGSSRGNTSETGYLMGMISGSRSSSGVNPTIGSSSEVDLKTAPYSVMSSESDTSTEVDSTNSSSETAVSQGVTLETSTSKGMSLETTSSSIIFPVTDSSSEMVLRPAISSTTTGHSELAENSGDLQSTKGTTVHVCQGLGRQFERKTSNSHDTVSTSVFSLCGGASNSGGVTGSTEVESSSHQSFVCPQSRKKSACSSISTSSVCSSCHTSSACSSSHTSSTCSEVSLENSVKKQDSGCLPEALLEDGQTSQASDRKFTPEERVREARRVRWRRWVRVRELRERLSGLEERTCPACYRLVQLADYPDHVEQCEDCSSEEEAEEDDGPLPQFEWCSDGRMRVRLTDVLRAQGRLHTLGTVLQRGAEDEQVDVCGEDDFGPPQIFEKDLSDFAARKVASLHSAATQESVAVDENVVASEASSSQELSRPNVGIENAEQSGSSSLPSPGVLKSADTPTASDLSEDPRLSQVVKSLTARVEQLEQQLAAAGTRNQLQCSVCRGDYDEPLVSTACWHVHCRSCWLSTLVNRRQCPQCQAITGLSDLRRVYV